MNERRSMFRPALGVSLHTVVTPLTGADQDLLERTGIRTVEILATRLFGGEARAVLDRMLARANVRAATVHCPFGGSLDISSLQAVVCEAGRGVLQESLSLAAELSARMIVVHASAEPIADGERATRLARSRESLAQVAEQCQQADVRIAVELLPRSCLGNTVDELFELLNGLPEHTFGVCLDVNHLMNRYGGLPDAVARLGERLFTLHLSDYDGVDEKHWMPGEGVIDWRGFMLALQDIGYRGPFNYEAKLRGDTPAERIRDLESNFTMLTGLLSS